jgi:outer membrane protein
MKKLRIMLPAILLMTVLSGSAMAQTKVETVDLRKLFDDFWKTKQAQAAIKQRADQLDKDDKSMRDGLKKATDDYQQLLNQANDQAISADERQKRQQAANDKLNQIQSSKAAIDQYERQAQATLSDQRQRMRENILKEITAAVAVKAKADGDTIVLDTAAETANGTLSVVYHSDSNDITAAVLAQLNAGAPIDTTTSTNSPSDTDSGN